LVGTITDSQDTMVKLSRRAVRLVVDTSRVELERLVRGVNSHRDGANVSHFLLERRLGAAGNVLIVPNGSANVGRVELALVGTSSSVGVGSLSINTVVLDHILEGIVHQTSVAAHVTLSSAAVNQVLLGKRDQGTSGDGMSAFNGTSRRERPAAAALTLVLDLSNNTLGPPVNVSGKGRRGNNSVSHHGDFVDLSQTLVQRVELLVGQISELVDSNSEGKVLLVGLANIIKVGLPDVEASLELFGGITLLVVLHPLGEESLVIWSFGQGEADEAQNHKGKEELSHVAEVSF